MMGAPLDIVEIMVIDHLYYMQFLFLYLLNPRYTQVQKKSDFMDFVASKTISTHLFDSVSV